MLLFLMVLQKYVRAVIELVLHCAVGSSARIHEGLSRTAVYEAGLCSRSSRYRSASDIPSDSYSILCRTSRPVVACLRCKGCGICARSALCGRCATYRYVRRVVVCPCWDVSATVISERCRRTRYSADRRTRDAPVYRDAGRSTVSPCMVAVRRERSRVVTYGSLRRGRTRNRYTCIVVCPRRYMRTSVVIKGHRRTCYF